MSIFDDIGHIAKEAWGKGVGTAESFGHAAIDLTPPGLIWDLATAHGDLKDRLFRVVGNITDPITNTNTLTGQALAPVLELGAAAYREGISEPIATADTVYGHALHSGDLGSIFDSSTWSQAYEVAQHRSIGQSWLLAARQGFGRLGVTDAGEDPLDTSAWRDIHEAHPFVTGTLSGGVDAAATWYVDPLVLAGKGVKAAKGANQRLITAEDRLAGIRNVAATDTGRRLGVVGPKIDGLKPRFDILSGTIEGGRHIAGYIDGKDAVDLYHGLGLDKYANGRQMAGLLAETNKTTDNVAKKINARRELLLTFAGDESAAGALTDEFAYVGDAAKNIAKGSVTGNQAGTVYDSVVDILADRGWDDLLPAASSAENVAEAERQLMNLPDLQEWLGRVGERYQRVLSNQSTLKSIPMPDAKGYRRIGRMSDNDVKVTDLAGQKPGVQGKGLLRSGEANTGHSIADDVLSRTLGRPLQAFYQYSPSHMPFQVIHGLTVKTLQAGPKFTDSFRNVRPEFVVDMNDLEDVTRNVDAYARRAGVTVEERRRFVSDLAATTVPIQRMKIVQEVEARAKKALLVKHGIADMGDSELDAFTRGVMRRFYHRRNSAVTSLQGRAYSTTKVMDNSPRVMKIRDTLAKQGKTPEEIERTLKDWRVDQFLEGGHPVHLPFLDTQDVSLLPMMPLDQVDTALARHSAVYRAAFRTWKDDRAAGGLAGDAKRLAGNLGDFAFEGKDRLWDLTLDTLDHINRVWKFSALFRLGYPIRIIADDHSRMIAAFGAHQLMTSLGAGLKHSAENSVRPFSNRWLATQLRAERQTLDDYVSHPEIYARNQAAWQEIGDIAKKLKTVKSARVRGRLLARQQILKEFNPEDLSHAKNRLDEIDKILTSKSYKIDKVRIGDHGHFEDIAGARVYLPGAKEGENGRVYAQKVSGVDAWGKTFGQTEASMFKNLSNAAGPARTIRAEMEPDAHLEAWAYAINHHLRNSELGRIVIDGGTKEDVLKFLRTPEGRRVIQKAPHQGAFPEQWAYDMERMVDEYLPNGVVKKIASDREVTRDDLETHFPDITGRPDVHGSVLEASTGMGHWAQMFNAGLNRFYKWVGTRNDVMSRHPLFTSLYNDELAVQKEYRVRLARQRGEHLTDKDIEEAAHAAREHAKKGVNRVLFEMGGTPEIAHLMRFISPFMAPWMEGLNRWWRIASNDPSVVRRFFMVFDAPRAAGLEVDQNGNPVPKGAPIEDGHYILLQLPQALGGADPKKHQSGFKVSETSFNMILQGGGLLNPGYGPMVQMPVNYYAVRNPENKEIQRAAKNILPYGTTADTLGMATPAAWDAYWTLASAKFLNHHSRQYVSLQNQLWRDRLIQYETDHGHPPTQTKANELFTEAGKDVVSMGFLKLATATLSPASVQFQSKFAAQQQAFYRLEEQGRLEKKPWDWAQKEFIKQWGEQFFPLVRSSSFNESGVSSTVGTVAALKRYAHLRDQVSPEMYRMIVSGEGEGAYSQTARNWLYTTPQRTGETQTFIEQNDPRQAMQDSITSQGWYDYSAFMNRLNLRANAMGLNTYLDSYQLQIAKKKGIAKLAEKNPVWWQDYNSFSPVEYDKSLEGMRVIANDPTLNSDPTRTDISVALRQYLQLRDWASSELERRGQIGGSSSPEALANRDILSIFTQQVSRLSESNPWFEQYSMPYIERDPYLLDSSQLIPVDAASVAA